MRAARYLPLAVEALAAHKPFFTSKVSEMRVVCAARPMLWPLLGS
jgi:hypothetical protein